VAHLQFADDKFDKMLQPGVMSTLNVVLAKKSMGRCVLH